MGGNGALKNVGGWVLKMNDAKLCGRRRKSAVSVKMANGNCQMTGAKAKCHVVPTIGGCYLCYLYLYATRGRAISVEIKWTKKCFFSVILNFLMGKLKIIRKKSKKMEKLIFPIFQSPTWSRRCSTRRRRSCSSSSSRTRPPSSS